MKPSNFQTATFGGGCFWCTETVFKRLRGVTSVVPGFSGGKRNNPSWEQVATGVTGHAEVVQIMFDPTIISYETLLDVFFVVHDPTTLNQQGYDKGTEYRSIIFYHNDEQKLAAQDKIQELEKQHKFMDPIVTQLETFDTFYEADSRHKDFYDNNRDYPYCRIIIDPKITKLMDNFKPLVKET